jgi:uncharacterized protein YndB with AHSA1/START domain
MSLEPIVLEVAVAAPIDRVWKAWTDADQLVTWLTNAATVQARVGGPYELFWEPDHPERNSTQGCQITGMSEYEWISLNWKGPEQYADLMNSEPLPTAVRVLFRAAGPGQTIVCLEHAGWGDGPRWAAARQWQERAWQVALTALQRQLEPE